MGENLTTEEKELLKRLIRPQSGKIPADEFDLRISLWQKLIVPYQGEVAVAADEAPQVVAG